jgi:hypothetical protein
MDTKRFALFLRHLSESLREDLHSRKARTGDVLEAYADELDPPTRAAPAEEAPPIVEPPAEEAPVVTKLREEHTKERHHKR